VAGPGLSPGFPGLTKPVSQYKIVGVTDPPRLDVPDKVTGKYVYVHNIKIPGMIHGRVVRPRGQGGYGDGTNPAVLSVDASSISRIPGAKVVQKGNFVGVVAPREYDAIQAAAQLKVKWAPMPPLAGDGNMWKQMRDFDSAGLAPARIVVSTGNTDAALAGAAKTVSQTYKYHYNGHLPIGPEGGRYRLAAARNDRDEGLAEPAGPSSFRSEIVRRCGNRF
jgi:nicotinate dehydrogenase subunit B